MRESDRQRDTKIERREMSERDIEMRDERKRQREKRDEKRDERRDRLVRDTERHRDEGESEQCEHNGRER